MSDDYDFKRDTLPFLDAGVFDQKVTRAVREVCQAVAAHGDKGKSGKVTLELKVTRIGESCQVQVDHKLVTLAPTARGKRSEENTTTTPLHVGTKGPSFLPNDQVDAFGEEVPRGD